MFHPMLPSFVADPPRPGPYNRRVLFHRRARLVVLSLTLSVLAAGCGAIPQANTSTAAATPSSMAPTTAPKPSPPRPHPSKGKAQRHDSPPAEPSEPAPSPSATDPLSTPKPPKPKPNPTPTVTPAGPDIFAYGGLGTWIDHYDNDDVYGPTAFGDPAAWVRQMKANGVRTVFLEAGSYKHPPIAFPPATAKFIAAAHRAGLKVVAWYLPLFRNVQHDFDEVMRVIGFRTPSGDGYDGFALDIEAAIVPPEQRIANFLRLSQRMRDAVGPNYALGAIIPSPRGMIRVPTYWPGFPYRDLPKYYDVVLPMSYASFHYHGAEAVGQYIRDNVEIVRRETGVPAIPVHVIGGIADDMTSVETRAFVSAAVTEHVFGASLYEFPRTSALEWELLQRLRS
jgi:hypothetical protein